MDELRVPERGKFVLSWANHPAALPLAVPASTCTWPRCAAWKSSCCGRRALRCPEPSWRKRTQAAKASAAQCARRRSQRGAAKARTCLREGMGLAAALRRQRSRARLREYLGDWCVKDRLVRNADANCHFMHCLPVRRNVAVADEVLDGPRSVVMREAFNRMVVQMAVLYQLLQG
jgi:ornithine carbamoyltransferase